MKTRIAAVTTLAALAFAAPSIALAQDRPPPSSDAEDRRLDEALRRAYGDPNGPPLPEPTDRSPGVVPPAPPPPGEKDDDDFKIRVGLVAAEWAARLSDASVRSRPNSGFGSDSGRVKIAGGGDSGGSGHHDWSDGDFAPAQTFHGWIDLGRWFSIQGGGRHVVFRDDGTASQAANGFTFGSQQFSGSYRTKFEITSADLDLAFHPVMCEWGQLDLTLGARYVASSVKFTATGAQATPVFSGPISFFPAPAPGPFGGNASTAASQSIETAMPMIGIGGTFRPVHIRELSVELYARARIGGIAYGDEDRGDDYRGRRGGFQYQNQNQGYGQPQDRLGTLAYSFEGEVGVSILVFQVIGISGGYHFEATQLQKSNSSETKNADWRVGGPFLGLVGEF